MFSFCLYGTLLLICVQSVASYRKGNSDCLLDYDEGICRALLKRFYYDSVNQTCEIFYYGGCLGNGNNFLSKEECERKCGGQIYMTEKSFARSCDSLPLEILCHLNIKSFVLIFDDLFTIRHTSVPVIYKLLKNTETTKQMETTSTSIDRSDNTETTITTQKPLSVGAKIVLGILDIKNKVSNLFKKIKGEK
uniref:Putative kunitz-type protease inhibitor n=1 Tax=Schistosoma mansoni TaxID=6183 RepID=A0A5K4F6V0_SCHMA